MGYRINYYKNRKKRNRCIVMKPKLYKFLLVFGVVAAVFLWPKARMWVKEVSIPGDNDVTRKAVSELVQNLEAGGNPHEALQVFCMEILGND